MREETIRKAIRLYGYEPRTVQPMLSGYRNESYPVVLTDGRVVNLIVYKREAGILDTIRNVNRLSINLAPTTLPIRRPIDPRIIRLSSSRGERYASLYSFMPGETIPWEAYTMEHLKLLGQSLAQLHTALIAYRDLNLPAATDQYLTLIQRVRRYFADEAVTKALARKLCLGISLAKLEYYKHLLTAAAQLPHQQPLHMDFVRSNILFSANPLRVTAILDFEKAAVGHPLFDIARTLAFLLVDCKYKAPSKVREYFLQSGYQKRGCRPIAQITVRHNGTTTPLLESLVDLFLLYDLYKFLRHNPYEYLSENEHFVRTRNLLCERAVITTSRFSRHRSRRLLQ